MITQKNNTTNSYNLIDFLSIINTIINIIILNKYIYLLINLKRFNK